MMKEWIKKAWAIAYLRWHGICPTHGTELEWYGFDPESMYKDCPDCVKEERARIECKVKRAKTILHLP